MDIVAVSKALSNPIRVRILDWLKAPEQNFPPHQELGHFDFGVCLVFIKEKSELSQSTISQYMAQLQQAELVVATRVGKWTYFKRNEEKIEMYIKTLQQTL